MTSTITLSLVDNVRIVVPDSLDLITPYVLQEQEDWFEDEIKFLRRLLQPGQKVIDIGANYGVYTLSIARTVGPTGSVWAFEPASSTAKLLAEGIAANGFTQVVLEGSALSSACGTAQLSLNDNSELNSLLRGAPSTSPSETVTLVTLDECMERYSWSELAFMKIDAEGEEDNILKGGARFFSELSPLVQYEIKAGAEVHLGLVQSFAALGYDSYRLVPGLDLLVPFDARSRPDGFLLNLFCCKPDRAKLLAARGFLLDSGEGNGMPSEPCEGAGMDESDRDAYGWRRTIGGLPYGTQLASQWEQTVSSGNSAEVEEAVSRYAFSRDSARSPAERYGALQASFSRLLSLCERQASHLRLATLARVAQDYGARSIAVNALQHLSNLILERKQVDPSEPFLAPGARFDSLAPGEALGNWILAAVLEELERLGHFSSFYTGPSAWQRLDTIRALGFGSPEMERRLSLLLRRFPPPG